MTFSHPINYAVKKYNVRMTARFTPANDCVLFVLLNLVFVALPSGIVWVDVLSSFVVSGVANALCFLVNSSFSFLEYERILLLLFFSFYQSKI